MIAHESDSNYFETHEFPGIGRPYARPIADMSHTRHNFYTRMRPSEATTPQTIRSCLQS